MSSINRIDNRYTRASYLIVQQSKFLMSSIEMVLTALRRVIRATDLHSRYLSKTSGLTTPQLIVLKTIGCSSFETTANHIISPSICKSP